MPTCPVDWAAIHASAAFQELHDRKSRVLWRLLAVAIGYYFALPIGAAWFTDIYRIPVWGPINVGLAFSLSQFLVVWVVAWIYARKAGAFDAQAAAIARSHSVADHVP